MSASSAWAGVRPDAARGAVPSRPALAVVRPRPAGPGRAPFVLLVVALLSAGLMGLLALNTALAQGSFTVGELQRRAGELADQTEALERAMARAQAPEHLADTARLLGMVPEVSPAYIRLADRTVSGRPAPAVASAHVLTPAERAAAAAQAAGTAGTAAAGKAAGRGGSAADRKKAAAAARAWQARLDRQQKAGPRSGGETVLVPPAAGARP